MTRTPNEEPPRAVKLMIPAGTYACLQRLAKMRRYGNNPTEVALYLVLREIDDLTRARVLPGDLIQLDAESESF